MIQESRLGTNTALNFKNNAVTDYIKPPTLFFSAVLVRFFEAGVLNFISAQSIHIQIQAYVGISDSAERYRWVQWKLIERTFRTVVILTEGRTAEPSVHVRSSDLVVRETATLNLLEAEALVVAKVLKRSDRMPDVNL